MLQVSAVGTHGYELQRNTRHLLKLRRRPRWRGMRQKAKRPANHASWDRDCPSMSAEKKKKAEKDPDSKYRFFPTEEDWTWERKDTPGVGMGAAMGRNTVHEEATGYEGAAERGWDWSGTADEGWAGMRAKRALGEVVGGTEEWRRVGPRGLNAGRGKKAPGEPVQATQASSSSRQATQSRPQSQLARPEGRSGRQSVLGDFWGDTDAGVATEQQTNPPTNSQIC